MGFISGILLVSSDVGLGGWGVSSSYSRRGAASARSATTNRGCGMSCIPGQFRSFVVPRQEKLTK